jgi:hypothetical protein
MTAHTLGVEFQDRRPRSVVWLLPLVACAIAVFALSALVYYHVRQDAMGEARSTLQLAVVGVYRGIGFVPAFLFFLLTLTWGSIWFLTGRIERPGMRGLRLVGLTLALAILVNLRADGAAALPHSGAIGGFIASRMLHVFGYVVSTLVVAPAALAALLLATDFFFYRYFEELGAGKRRAVPATGSLDGERGVETAVTEHLKGLAQRPQATAEATAPAPDTVPYEPRRVRGDSARRWAEARERARAQAEDEEEVEAEVDRTAAEEPAWAGSPAAAPEPDAVLPARDDNEFGDGIELNTFDEGNASEAGAGDMADEEPVVPIPRPTETATQRRLFPEPVDEDLVRDAESLILESGRASASQLERRLRISYEHAMQLLSILAERGLIEIDAGAAQGRVIGDP